MNKHLRHRGVAFALIAIVAVVSSLLPAGAQTEPDSTITVEGGGWGHGVGMSQYGAYGRAADGHTVEEILGFYYPGAELTSPNMPEVRVHLHSGRGTIIRPVDAPSGDPADDIEIVDGDGNVIFNHGNGRNLEVRKVPGGFTVVRSNSTGGRNLCIAGDGTDRCQVDELRFRFQQGSPTEVDVINQVSIGTTDNHYQWGELVVYERAQSPNDTLWVVLEGLTMDQYIYGLAEVPASWPAATLQAQAVAGRTYGYDRILDRRSSSSWNVPWDLYSTVDDQVYHGYDKESSVDGDRWVAAVDATSDQVLLYNDDPITAFYSSSNGGHSEVSDYVFVTALPYLPAQPDSYDSYQNPFATWSRDYTGSEVGQWLRNSGLANVGAVTSVRVSGNIGDSGRVDRATVTVSGPGGTAEMSGNSFRNSINIGVSGQGGGLSRQILSTKYTVSVLGGEDPVGALDVARRRGDDVTVRGWVFDPDSLASVTVDIRVDGSTVATLTADETRFDVDAVFPGGQRRGYEATVTVPSGARQLCVYADNLGPGAQQLLGCQVV